MEKYILTFENTEGATRYVIQDSPLPAFHYATMNTVGPRGAHRAIMDAIHEGHTVVPLQYEGKYVQRGDSNLYVLRNPVTEEQTLILESIKGAAENIANGITDRYLLSLDVDALRDFDAAINGV